MAISPQQLKIYLTSAHRAVIFAIAQLSCNFWAAVTVIAFALLSCSTVHVTVLFYNCFIEQMNE